MERLKRQASFGLPEKKSADNRAASLIRGLFGATFVELGAYHGSRDADGKPVLCNTITGYGAVDEALVYVFAQDGSDRDGAVSAVSAEKIVSIINRSNNECAPLVGFFDSCGAQLYDGMAALSGYGKIMHAVAKKRGRGPMIAIITGSCTGGLAVIAEMFDVVIAIHDAKFYVNPTYIARDALKEQGISAPELGTASAAAMRGEISLLCKDTDDAISSISKLLSFIAYPEEETSDSFDRLTERAVQLFAASEYDSHELIEEICDNGNYFESHPGYANELLTVFGRVCGDTVAIVSSNPSHHQGLLSERAARKAANFINFANSLKIPVVTLVDTEGFDTTAHTELERTASHMASLAYAYASAANTHITVVTGRAYGTASVILGSRALGADICLAVEDADMSILDPDTVVQFIYGDEIDSSSDPSGERRRRVNEWKKVHAGTVEAAMYGDIDDVINPAELRSRIAAAVKECRQSS